MRTRFLLVLGAVAACWATVAAAKPSTVPASGVNVRVAFIPVALLSPVITNAFAVWGRQDMANINARPVALFRQTIPDRINVASL